MIQIANYCFCGPFGKECLAHCPGVYLIFRGPRLVAVREANDVRCDAECDGPSWAWSTMPGESLCYAACYTDCPADRERVVQTVRMECCL